MNAIKSLARNWLPPAIVRWIRKQRGEGISFEGEFPTWVEASARCAGYNSEDILAKVLNATLKVKLGEAAFERDSVIFDHLEYAWPVLSGLLLASALSGGKLNVLDFGGALGSSYFQSRKLIQALPEVHWNVVEQSHYVEAGKKHIQDNQLRFYKNIEECLSENQPNVILLSSVLQYIADPQRIIDELVAVKADVFILDRTIINHSDTHRIYLQHVPASIYSATYPCRSLSESLLINSIVSNYQMIADFPSLQFPALLSIGSEFKGYIFREGYK